MTWSAVTSATNQHACDAKEVQPVRTGLHVFTLFFGILGIDAGNQIPFFSQVLGEVFSVGPTVFTTKERMLCFDLMIGTGFLNLFEEVVDSFGIIPYPEWLTQNIPFPLQNMIVCSFLA